MVGCPALPCVPRPPVKSPDARVCQYPSPTDTAPPSSSALALARSTARPIIIQPCRQPTFAKSIHDTIEGAPHRFPRATSPRRDGRVLRPNQVSQSRSATNRHIRQSSGATIASNHSQAPRPARRIRLAPNPQGAKIVHTPATPAHVQARWFLRPRTISDISPETRNSPRTASRRPPPPPPYARGPDRIPVESPLHPSSTSVQFPNKSASTSTQPGGKIWWPLRLALAPGVESVQYPQLRHGLERVPPAPNRRVRHNNHAPPRNRFHNQPP